MQAVFRKLSRHFRRTSKSAERLRLHAPVWPAAVYAIGDVHGCYDELRELERQIADKASTVDGEKWIVMLGDYVDKGPMSAAVLEHLLMPPLPGFKRYCLAGNHEIMMLNFLGRPRLSSQWLRYGGLATLQAYGLDLQELSGLSGADLKSELATHIPIRHVAFLHALPTLLSVPGVVFVHAGIRPGVTLEQQKDEDLLWIREPFLSAQDLGGVFVIHGHTPEMEPATMRHRIGLDTGVFETGRLTAAAFIDGHLTEFLHT